MNQYILSLKAPGDISVVFDRYPSGEIDCHLENVPENLGNSTIRLKVRWASPTFNQKGQVRLDELFLIKNILDTCFPANNTELQIGYFPGGRQDRAFYPYGSQGIMAYAKAINALQFNKVVIYDLHNQAVQFFVNNCEIKKQSVFARKAVLDFEPDTILYPDEGAARKWAVYYNTEEEGIPAIYCKKVRSKHGVEVSVPKFKGDRIIVLDDICDGGRTFTSLAEKIKKENPAAKLGLYVTHGIFSAGLEPLQQHFEHVYCTDTFHHNFMNPEFLTYIE
jgi:ribose-phosphate pyrophosphokinase